MWGWKVENLFLKIYLSHAIQSLHGYCKKKKSNSLLARQNLANCRNHKGNSMRSLCVMVKNLLVLLVSMYKYQTIKIPY